MFTQPTILPEKHIRDNLICLRSQTLGIKNIRDNLI